MTKDLRVRLKKLGVERLADLLIEVAEHDHNVSERLKVITASRSELLKTVKSQLSGLKRTRKFHDYRDAKKLQQKVELTLQSITQLEVEPKIRCQLIFSFYRTDQAVFGHCDDSTGLLS